MPESYLGNRGIIGGTTVQVGIESANVQLAVILGELEGEDSTGDYALVEEIADERRVTPPVIILKAQSHHAISGEFGTVQNRQSLPSYRIDQYSLQAKTRTVMCGLYR